jgi:hypothetical protein
MICPNAHLLFLGIAIECAKVDIAGGFVDPGVCSRGLKAFVNDDGREGKE